MSASHHLHTAEGAACTEPVLPRAERPSAAPLAQHGPPAAAPGCEAPSSPAAAAVHQAAGRAAEALLIGTQAPRLTTSAGQQAHLLGSSPTAVAAMQAQLNSNACSTHGGQATPSVLQLAPELLLPSSPLTAWLPPSSLPPCSLPPAPPLQLGGSFDQPSAGLPGQAPQAPSRPEANFAAALRLTFKLHQLRQAASLAAAGAPAGLGPGIGGASAAASEGALSREAQARSSEQVDGLSANAQMSPAPRAHGRQQAIRAKPQRASMLDALKASMQACASAAAVQVSGPSAAAQSGSGGWAARSDSAHPAPLALEVTGPEATSAAHKPSRAHSPGRGGSAGHGGRLPAVAPPLGTTQLQVAAGGCFASPAASHNTSSRPASPDTRGIPRLQLPPAYAAVQGHTNVEQSSPLRSNSPSRGSSRGAPTAADFDVGPPQPAAASAPTDATDAVSLLLEVADIMKHAHQPHEAQPTYPTQQERSLGGAGVGRRKSTSDAAVVEEPPGGLVAAGSGTLPPNRMPAASAAGADMARAASTELQGLGGDRLTTVGSSTLGSGQQGVQRRSHTGSPASPAIAGRPPLAQGEGAMKRVRIAIKGLKGGQVGQGQGQGRQATAAGGQAVAGEAQAAAGQAAAVPHLNLAQDQRGQQEREGPGQQVQQQQGRQTWTQPGRAEQSSRQSSQQVQVHDVSDDGDDVMIVEPAPTKRPRLMDMAPNAPPQYLIVRALPQVAPVQQVILSPQALDLQQVPLGHITPMPPQCAAAVQQPLQLTPQPRHAFAGALPPAAGPHTRGPAFTDASSAFAAFASAAEDHLRTATQALQGDRAAGRQAATQEGLSSAGFHNQGQDVGGSAGAASHAAERPPAHCLREPLPPPSQPPSAEVPAVMQAAGSSLPSSPASSPRCIRHACAGSQGTARQSVGMHARAAGAAVQPSPQQQHQQQQQQQPQQAQQPQPGGVAAQLSSQYQMMRQQMRQYKTEVGARVSLPVKQANATRFFCLTAAGPCFVFHKAHAASTDC